MSTAIEIIPSVFFDKTIGMSGRMISGSKSGYRKVYPENVAIFNANLVTEFEGRYAKVWHGDIDLTFDHAKLLKLSELSGKKLYVLFEMDARFENEENPLIEKHVASYDASQPQNLQAEVGKYYAEYLIRDLNVIKYVKP